LSVSKRVEQIDRSHPHLSVMKQCELLSVNRSTIYYQKAEKLDIGDVTLMNEIREIWLNTDFHKL